MNVAMVVIGGAVILAIYATALLQHSGAVVAADHLTWILGFAILAAGAGIAGKTAL